MADIDLTTTATIPSASQSITVTVNEDTDGDGVAENSASQVVDDGTNTYTLTGFVGGSGNDYWLDIEPSTSDETTTASLDSAALDVPEIIDAPASILASSTPRPSVDPGTVSVGAPVTTITSVTPLPGFVRSLAAPATTVTAESPTPGVAAVGTVTVPPPATAVAAASPSPTVGFLHWLVDGALLPTATSESVSHRTLSLAFRVTTQDLLNTLRALKANEGQVSVLATDDGGYTSVDRANGGNTFSLVPPATRRPLRRETDYHVQRYEEDLVSQRVDEWTVELEVTPSASRSDAPSIGEAAATDEWGLTTRYGTIATARVDAGFLGTGADGVERFELTARLSFTQAHVLEAALARLGGVRVRAVVDESNQAVDDTSSDANTITVASPTPSVVPDGDYVVLEFESRRLNDAWQEVSLVIAQKG